MIDRAARNMMLEAMEQFMRGEIIDAEFGITAAGVTHIDGTDDTTVELFDSMILSFIESPTDKTFPHNRNMWDFFNRARLLMAGNAEIILVRKRKWVKWQALALLAVLVLIPLIVLVLVGTEPESRNQFAWLGLSLLCGGITALLQRWRQRDGIENSPEIKYAETWPFPSHEEMMKIQQSLPGFEEWKYPFEDDIPLQNTRTHHLFSSLIICCGVLLFVVIFCLLSPIILLRELRRSEDIELRIAPPFQGGNDF